jgi:hypothetical protein
MGIALAFQGVAFADEEAERPELNRVAAPSGGFFYDAKTNRYFSDGKSSFTLRPVGDRRALERIELSIDDGDFKPFTESTKFDQEGFHLVKFRAVDPSLHWNPVQEFRIYVDLTPPKSFPFWHGPSFQRDGALFVSPQSVLSIVAQDSVSGVSQIVWDDGGKSASFPGQLHFKTEGEHVVRFYSVDNVGNREPVQEMKFVVDAKAPETKAEVHGSALKTDAGNYVNGASEVILTSQDAGSGVKVIEYQLNGGPITEYRQPIPMIDRKLEVKFHAIDAVGNSEAWKNIVLLQDMGLPTIAVEKIGNYVASGGRIFATPGFALNITAKDDESGLGEVVISRDGKSWEKSQPGKVTFDQPGEYHFFARAIDRVGNTRDANPYTIVIDNQPPKTLVKANERLVQKDGVFLSAIPNQIEFQAADDGVGVDRTEGSYDGRNWFPIFKGIDVSQWTQSKRIVYFRSVDRLGNREAPQSMQIVLKSEQPKQDLFVETEKLPDVPLSQVRGMRLPATQEPAVEQQPELQEGPPVPTEHTRRLAPAKIFTGPPVPDSEQGPQDPGPSDGGDQ